MYAASPVPPLRPLSEGEQGWSDAGLAWVGIFTSACQPGPPAPASVEHCIGNTTQKLGDFIAPSRRGVRTLVFSCGVGSEWTVRDVLRGMQ